MTEKVKMPDGSTAAACKLLKGLLNRTPQNRYVRHLMSKSPVAAGLASPRSLRHLVISDLVLLEVLCLKWEEQQV